MNSIPQNTQATQVTFDDLLIHDFTQAIEYRDNGDLIQEFDLVRMPFAGMWIEGVITEITEDYIELDDFWVIDIEDAEHGELIARAEADSGFIVEYNAYLDNMETLYAVAVQETSRLATRVVA